MPPPAMMSTKPRILFFSRDFGGVNAILPVAQAMRGGVEFDAIVVSHSLSRSLYECQGIDSIALEDWGYDDEPGGAWRGLLECIEPDLVATGKSAPLCAAEATPEQILAQAARAAGIPRIAVLDSWGDYRARYSKNGTDIDPDYCPDVICALDALSRQMLIDAGVNKNAIAVTRNPHFDRVFRDAAAARVPVDDIREGANNILYVSQPTREKAGVAEFGFDQETLFVELVAGLDRVRDAQPPAHVIVWPHSKESMVDWPSLVARTDGAVSCCIGSHRDARIFKSIDALFTYHSTVVYEALYYDVPCWSLMIGTRNRENDPLVTNRSGLSEAIFTPSQLDAALARIGSLSHRDTIRHARDSLQNNGLFFTDGKATERVLTVIRDVLAEWRTPRAQAWR